MHRKMRLRETKPHRTLLSPCVTLSKEGVCWGLQVLFSRHNVKLSHKEMDEKAIVRSYLL